MKGQHWQGFWVLVLGIQMEESLKRFCLFNFQTHFLVRNENKGGKRMNKLSKQENSWVFYDWANSAYSILITTAIFPLYFKAAATNAGLAASISTAYWGYANSFATLLISICAPILG